MKTPRALILTTLVIAVCAGGFAAAQTSPSQAPPKASGPDIQALDRYIASELESRGLVGLSAAVMIDGKVVLAKGYGRAALGGSLVTLETSFAVGSITKQFTCACILKLAEAGKLQVTDKVAKYYPDLTRADGRYPGHLRTARRGGPEALARRLPSGQGRPRPARRGI